MPRFMPALAVGVILALALAMPASAAGNNYKIHRLVSDQPGVAAFTDPNLINGWGLAAGPSTPWWVADEGTDKSTIYAADGTPIPLVVIVHNGPTGIVYNGTGEFRFRHNGEAGPAVFMFAGMDGRIRGWNSNVGANSPSNKAFVVADRSGVGAIYTGLAIGENEGNNYIYAADFHNGRVDVFDGNFMRQHWMGAFRDPSIPDEFSPFGIYAFDEYVFVAYAEQEGNTGEEEPGPHLGFVDAYSTSGELLERVGTRGPLNAPWGMAWAPNDFGRFSGDLLVGNFGNGKIHAYKETASGWTLDGTLRRPNGNPVVIDGLWGIAFGNDGPAGEHNELYFAAGPDDEAHGLFGYIEAE